MVNVRGMTADDHDDDYSVILRLRSTADLSPARHRLATLFADTGVAKEESTASVLAICELLTNALEAADPESIVTAVVSVNEVFGHGALQRRIAADIVNVGEPMLGRLDVDRNVQLGHRRARGRGLALAGRMGDVVVEGLVGGTRARFRRDVVGDSGADRVS